MSREMPIEHQLETRVIAPIRVTLATFSTGQRPESAPRRKLLVTGRAAVDVFRRPHTRHRVISTHPHDSHLVMKLSRVPIRTMHGPQPKMNHLVCKCIENVFRAFGFDQEVRGDLDNGGISVGVLATSRYKAPSARTQARIPTEDRRLQEAIEMPTVDLLKTIEQRSIGAKLILLP